MALSYDIWTDKHRHAAKSTWLASLHLNAIKFMTSTTTPKSHYCSNAHIIILMDNNNNILFKE